MSNRHELEQRALAAYWGLALGDALGATVEFMTPNEIRHEYGVHNKIRGGGWLRLAKGQVTDDTQMALALGDAILQQGELQAIAVAEHFDHWLRSKPADVGQTVRRGIVNFRKTGIPVVPESSDAGNGACMRLLPVALMTLGQSQERVQHLSRQQAHITHHNELSDAGCEAVIAMLHLALQGGDKRELLEGPIASLVQQYPQFNFRRRAMTNPSGYIVDTLQAVLQAFIDTDSFYDCLVEVVNRGGDADTTGAIAGMIAGAYYGVKAIPAEWLAALDTGICEHCQNQAHALLHLATDSAAAVTAPPLKGAVI